MREGERDENSLLDWLYYFEMQHTKTKLFSYFFFIWNLVTYKNYKIDWDRLHIFKELIKMMQTNITISVSIG